MEFVFSGLKFDVQDNKIRLIDLKGFTSRKDSDDKDLFGFAEVQIAGGNQITNGAKQILMSESQTLLYKSHSIKDGLLSIVQQNANVRVTSYFQSYENTGAIRVWADAENVSGKDIVLEHVSSLVLYGMGEKGTGSVNELFLQCFTNSWHVECQPVRHSFFDWGLQSGTQSSKKRLAGCNTGSWSTKEQLPQAIIEDSAKNRFLMFQIESNNSWYYEIGDISALYYLNIGGPNQTFNQWSKKLEPGKSFTTVKAAVCVGGSVNDVVGQMTKYRRNIVKPCGADTHLPSIFNEYMHLSWDSPFEEQTAKIAPVVAGLGAQYYVIDCGWHDEVSADKIYRRMGAWKPSKMRFPKGIKHTVDLIHGLGMKAGLWIEPEIIGFECEEMLSYYDDGCFLKRNGQKICQLGRLFLDFRNKKVRDYLTDTIKRMVEDYGADYIKFDFNQDCGAGTELDSDSLGDGLVKHGEAYQDWVEKMQDKYPHIIIEACSSGGQRMDYKTLSLHSLVSTSDQTDYKKYPFIAGNILSAVLPEQAAVWAYPAAHEGGYDDAQAVNDAVSLEVVAQNMINSFLGRMHLASHVEMLSDAKQELIAEGIAYYNKISKDKKTALPYFPSGFCGFNSQSVASALVCGKKIYLAVWYIKGEKTVSVPLPEFEIENVKIAYPMNMPLKTGRLKHAVEITFEKENTARMLEIDIK